MRLSHLFRVGLALFDCLPRRSRYAVLLGLLVVAGCAVREIIVPPPVNAITVAQLHYPSPPPPGAAPSPLPPTLSIFNAGNRFTSWRGQDDYLANIQPLLGKRCVACHGCTDAPCQVKLNSYLGVRRGATRVSYYANRLLEAPFPELRIDAPGFYPIVADTGDVQRNLEQSMLYRFITQGQNNTTDTDHAGAFDLEQVRPLQQEYDVSAKHQCVVTDKDFHAFIGKNPGAGMPFGLPRLNDQEYGKLQTWLGAGARGPGEAAQRALRQAARPEVIARWERFLNGLDAKSRLLARYLYEHLFAMDFHFAEMPGEFYRLERGREDDGGGPWRSLQTPLPVDSPGPGDFSYRFVKVEEIISQKDHVVWQVSDATLDYLRDLFMTNAWLVPDDQVVVPGYDNGNPFEVYQQIPAELRYRFMLDNAKLFIEAMVRGSVCIGRTATYAISDQFWVFFLRPESDVSAGTRYFRLGSEAMRALSLDTDRMLVLMELQDRFYNNKIYLEGYERALRQELQAQYENGQRARPGLGLEDIWDGGGDNPNAWLTVLRHDASATVHFGAAGGFPQTVWVLNFANFERLFYNLVAQFKYWGSITHKLVTWQVMSQDRLEGEDLFLSFLPEAARGQMRELYAGGVNLPAAGVTGLIGKPLVGKKIRRAIELYPLLSLGRPALQELSGLERPDMEFLRHLIPRFSDKVRAVDADLNSNPLFAAESVPAPAPTAGMVHSIAEFEANLHRLISDGGKGRYAPFLPSITLLRVGDAQRRELYSIISNRGYFSHELVFAEKQERDPSRDTISVYHGVVGDYPELFLDVPLARAAEFLRRVQAINAANSQDALRTLKDDFAVRRNSSRFWPFVDWVLDRNVKTGDGYITAGMLDLSRYDLYDRN